MVCGCGAASGEITRRRKRSFTLISGLLWGLCVGGGIDNTIRRRGDVDLFLLLLELAHASSFNFRSPSKVT